MFFIFIFPSTCLTSKRAKKTKNQESHQRRFLRIVGENISDVNWPRSEINQIKNKPICRYIYKQVIFLSTCAIKHVHCFYSTVTFCSTESSLTSDQNTISFFGSLLFTHVITDVIEAPVICSPAAVNYGIRYDPYAYWPPNL